MNDFLKRVLKGNGILPSDVCLRSLNENFADAKNVEWFGKGNYYEAIFYKNDLEHIAVFDLSGILMEYRQNLPSSDYLPESIKKIALSKGEIMNSILRNMGNLIEYEVIIRDVKLNRYLIMFSETGNIVEEKKLSFNKEK